MSMTASAKPDIENQLPIPSSRADSKGAGQSGGISSAVGYVWKCCWCIDVELALLIDKVGTVCSGFFGSILAIGGLTVASSSTDTSAQGMGVFVFVVGGVFVGISVFHYFMLRFLVPKAKIGSTTTRLEHAEVKVGAGVDQMKNRIEDLQAEVKKLEVLVKESKLREDALLKRQRGNLKQREGLQKEKEALIVRYKTENENLRQVLSQGGKKLTQQEASLQRKIKNLERERVKLTQGIGALKKTVASFNRSSQVVKIRLGFGSLQGKILLCLNSIHAKYLKRDGEKPSESRIRDLMQSLSVIRGHVKSVKDFLESTISKLDRR